VAEPCESRLVNQALVAEPCESRLVNQALVAEPCESSLVNQALWIKPWWQSLVNQASCLRNRRGRPASIAQLDKQFQSDIRYSRCAPSCIGPHPPIAKRYQGPRGHSEFDAFRTCPAPPLSSACPCHRHARPGPCPPSGHGHPYPHPFRLFPSRLHRQVFRSLHRLLMHPVAVLCPQKTSLLCAAFLNDDPPHRTFDIISGPSMR